VVISLEAAWFSFHPSRMVRARPVTEGEVALLNLRVPLGCRAWCIVVRDDPGSAYFTIDQACLPDRRSEVELKALFERYRYRGPDVPRLTYLPRPQSA
jgi:hypothetical protein